MRPEYAFLQKKEQASTQTLLKYWASEQPLQDLMAHSSCSE